MWRATAGTASPCPTFEAAYGFHSGLSSRKLQAQFIFNTYQGLRICTIEWRRLVLRGCSLSHASWQLRLPSQRLPLPFLALMAPSNLQTFINSVDPSIDFSPENFKRKFKEQCNEEFAEAFKEVQTTATSCGRPIYWIILVIEPNKAFKFHAHPNIEVDYVLKGKLFQTAIVNETLERSLFSSGTIEYDGWDHPDIEESGSGSGHMLLNKPGSAHQTFTKDEGATLLCLMSGKWTKIESHNKDIDHALKPVSAIGV